MTVSLPIRLCRTRQLTVFTELDEEIPKVALELSLSKSGHGDDDRSNQILTLTTQFYEAAENSEAKQLLGDAQGLFIVYTRLL